MGVRSGYRRISASPPRDTFWHGRRGRKAGVNSTVVALIVLIAALILAGGIIAALILSPSASREVLSTAHAAPVVEPLVLPALKPGPEALQSRLDILAKDFGEPVGIAVAHVSDNWMASVAPDQPFPQQSVSKLWVALATLDAVDRGLLSLDSGLLMGLDDRSVFNQPLAHNIGETGHHTTVSLLLRHALVSSDNSANDRLIRQIGIPGVNAFLSAKGITGVRLGADERHLQSMIAGLAWTPDLGEPTAFEQARAKLPTETRKAALMAYLADPVDGATPRGIVQGLAALQRGQLLSPQTTAFMLDTLQHVRTGPMRLKGGLPQGWTCAHKTGTGQDFRGASVGINDVGLLTAPDGQTFAVAVMIPFSSSPNSERLALMQAVTRAVAETWRPRNGNV